MSIEDLTASLSELNLSTDSNSTSESPPEVPVVDFAANLPIHNNLNIEDRHLIDNFLNSSNNNLNNMANTFKPEYLNCVPTFDGNATELNRYLTTCQTLINNFYDGAHPDNFQNIYLINSLISKLNGNARLVINIQNVTTWAELKDTLTRNFADRRDESCLTRDLVMLKQLPHETPQTFYDKCLELLNLLCSYVDAHEQAPSAGVKRDLYQKLALKTFLSGLREPLGTTVRCMRPQTLSEAVQLVIQEGNVKYFQNQSPNNAQQPHKKSNQLNRFTNHNSYSNVQSQTPHFNSFRPQFNNFANHNQFRPSFPSQAIPIRPNPNYRPQKFFTNSEVFGRSQNQNKNVFKPDPNKPLPRPTPMSVSTRNTFRPNSIPGPSYQPNQPKYIAEELYNTETNSNLNNENNLDYETYGIHDLPYNYPYYEYEEYPQGYLQPENNDPYEAQPIEESQNFQELPAETKES